MGGSDKEDAQQERSCHSLGELSIAHFHLTNAAGSTLTTLRRSPGHLLTISRATSVDVLKRQKVVLRPVESKRRTPSREELK
jgi:hypothetical protein